jgi:hypothetical protein
MIQRLLTETGKLLLQEDVSAILLEQSGEASIPRIIFHKIKIPEHTELGISLNKYRLGNSQNNYSLGKIQKKHALGGK